MIKSSDLNATQYRAFTMWRNLGLSTESALRAMQEDGVLPAPSEHDRLAETFRSAFGLSEEGARLAVQGRDGGRAVSEAGSRSVSEALSEMSDDDFGRLLADEQRRRGASGKSKG